MPITYSARHIFTLSAIALFLAAIPLAARSHASAVPQSSPVTSATEAQQGMAWPTLVTLHFTDVAPRVVFAEMFRQAGLPWHDYDARWTTRGGGWPKVSVNLDKQPFWLAMQTVCEQAGVQPIQTNLPDGQPMEQYFDRGPTVTAVPFLVVQEDWLHYSPNPPVELWFTLFLDPRLHRAPGNATARVTEAVDDAGNSLLPDTPRRAILYPSQDLEWRFGMRLPIKHPGVGIKTIRKISAIVQMPVIARTQPWTITDIVHAPHQSRELNGFRYTFESVGPRPAALPGVYEVRGWVEPLRPEGPGPSAPDPSPFLHLRDAQGRELTQTVEFDEPADRRREYAPEFEADDRPAADGPVGPPATLVWDLPADTATVEVPITFQNIAAPQFVTPTGR